MRSNYAARILEFAQADLRQLRGRSDRTRYLELFGGYDNARGYSARANDELAAYVSSHTAPEDLIYQFGINGAGVYFATNRIAAHRFMRVNMFVQSDLNDPNFQLPIVTEQIAGRRPMYLIFERLHTQTALGRAVDSLPGDPASYGCSPHIGWRHESRISRCTGESSSCRIGFARHDSRKPRASAWYTAAIQ